MTPSVKKKRASCSLERAAAASFKIEQNYSLTQFTLQTPDTKIKAGADGSSVFFFNCFS
jgi:hypothetical protein